MNTEAAPSTAPTALVAPLDAPGISLDPIIEKVLEEMRAAETDVSEKTAALATAREKLAAARGKMEMIGIIQQHAARDGQAQP